MKLILTLSILFSLSAYSYEGFKLPSNWEEIKAQNILEIKSLRGNDKYNFKVFCSFYADKSMTTDKYIRMLAYTELTGLGCGEVI